MAAEQLVQRAARARASLEYLDEQGADGCYIPIADVWLAVRERVPFTEHEAQPTQKGRPRGESDWRWSSADLAAAGWLRKHPDGSGQWAITDAGRQALRDFPGDELHAEATRRYAAGRVELQSAIAEALPSTWVSTDGAQRKLLEAARVWVEQSLQKGASVFSPGRDVWSADAVERLHHVWSIAEKEEGKNFAENVASQLGDESDDVKLLMAEIVALQILPISSAIGHAKKTQKVEAVLALMQHRVSIPALFDEAFGGGAFNPGSGMLSRVNHAVTIILNMAKAWVELEADEQEAVLLDPIAWRDFILGIEGDDFPTQRWSLMYLVHPGFFGPIVSTDHRRRIRDAFIGEIGGTSSGDPDVDLQRITLALQQKTGKPVDLYKTPHREMWQDASPPAPEPDPRPVDSTELQTEPRGFRPGDVDIATLSDQLKLDGQWIARVIDALHRRGQVILYGPPGTGKTYVAKAITKALSTKADASVRIQFHPSYTYEDFFAGYRPREKNGQLVFELTRGPLRRISDAARRDPDVTHVLMIDEINRANLSKVFGELYYLLEYRDEPIDLLYAGSGTDGGDTFSLPPNVVIIGTMNTADRSIALLDSAMRRRFSFFELHPDVPPVAGILDRWTAVYPQTFDLAGLFAELNSRIRDREDRIGPSHLLRTDDLSRSALDAIWTESLMPLLEERHLGSATDVHATFALSVLLGKMTPAAWDVDAESASGEEPRA
ncbi:MAG: AAA family ATPase [Actinobacteria bacterium]|nr:AAA family ATPase [Actinomycetota bacterium]